MKKEAASITKTKQKIQEAFLDLCMQRGLSDITISAVTKKAGCNRCTFYNYYDDMNGLLAETEDDLIGQLQEKMSELYSEGLPKDISAIFSILLTAFEEYGDILYTLLSEKGDPTFRNKLKQAAVSYFSTAQLDFPVRDKMDYVFCYAVSAWTGLIEHWYETGKKESTKDFLHLSQVLVANGVLGAMKEAK